LRRHAKSVSGFQVSADQHGIDGQLRADDSRIDILVLILSDIRGGPDNQLVKLSEFGDDAVSRLKL
jgi:hypothetical protein